MKFYRTCFRFNLRNIIFAYSASRHYNNAPGSTADKLSDKRYTLYCIALLPRC